MATQPDNYRSGFSGVKRLVIKVGTSTLTYSTGKLNLSRLEQLAREIADLANQGREVVLVTSGAVGAGIGRLGLRHYPRTMPEKQAAAAVGQGILMHMYEKFLMELGHVVGQVLLTREDLADRRRYLNARNTLLTLIHYGVIPIVNENDTVAIDEIRLGDNDTLSALVAGLVDAELLILLTDAEGLCARDPRSGPEEAAVLPVVQEITPEIEKLAGGAGSPLATGGMSTKLAAARIAQGSGIPMVIANGSEPGVIARVLRGECIGTLFVPREGKMHSKERWIAFGSEVQGRIYIDAGASRALLTGGKSLLPIGVVGVEGNFDTGAVISIVTSSSGKEIGRGIVNYSAKEIEKIMGKKTADIPAILGYKDYDEVVHRNNLVFTGGLAGD